MATKGTGTTLTLTTSGFTAELIDVSGPGVSRPSLDSSHMGTTGYRTYLMATLIEGGEMSATFQYDVGDTPPISAEIETITIAFAGSGGVSFQGAMGAYSITATLDEIMQATATIKVCDDVSWS